MPSADATPRDFAAMDARRLDAARRFERGASQAAVARALGVTRTTTHRWFHVWRVKGRAGLRGPGRPGMRPAVDEGQLGQLDHALRRGPRAHGFDDDWWTLPRVATVIERLTGVRHRPGYVWTIMRKLSWRFQPGRASDGRPYRGRHGNVAQGHGVGSGHRSRTPERCRARTREWPRSATWGKRWACQVMEPARAASLERRGMGCDRR
jgi:transposase